MDEVNRENRGEGLPDVEMGIGINTGEVVVGNIGSQKRTKYGIVGSHVNLTSRIESYTIGGQILISESTRKAVEPIVSVTQQMEIEAKGIDQAITIHDIRGIGGPYDLFLPDDEEVFASLPYRLPVRYSGVDGKYLEEQTRTGYLVKLSAKGGELLTDGPLERHSNLKLQLVGAHGDVIPGDMYAKVMRDDEADAPRFTIRFTSIPPEVKTFLQDLIALYKPGNAA